MKKLLLFLILLIYSCESEKSKNDTNSDFHFSSYNVVLSDGHNFFSKNLSKNMLINSLGEISISDTTEWIEEGTVEIKATQIYPNTDSSLTLYWNSNNKLKSIRLDKENSIWNINGLKVGMALDEVEKTNSTDFNFYGFGWDNGGLVYDWNNGTHANSTNNVSVNLNLNWENVGNKNIDKFMGDYVKLNSNNKELRELGITVYSIIVKY